LGDVKLAAVAGAWTGLAGTSTVLLLACAAALTFVGIAALIGKRQLTRQTPLPFGAFLAPAIWLTWALAQLNA
ncbi:MAG: prepilin peptidase, partial [Hyphomicrobiaceae bacterium]